MNDIIEYVKIKKNEFSELELFKYLQNANIEPINKLAFLPCLTHWIMNFSDLNQYIFREEPTNDKLQKLINTYTYEDDNHWVWFLEDIKNLGFDSSQDFSQTVKFIWGKETKKVRQISYKIAAYTFQATPIQKFAVIEAIEAAGNVFFCLSTQLIKDLSCITNKDYRYLGDFHLDQETRHIIGFHQTKQLIQEIQLTEDERQKALKLVEDVFQLFAEASDEVLAYLKKQSSNGTLPTDMHPSAFSIS